MTKEQLESANLVHRKIKCVEHLIDANQDIQQANFNFLFHFDKEFHEEFLQLSDKYYKKYTEQFEEL